MTRIHATKTNFTQGELSPELYGRPDLRAYENGAARLRNVFIQPTGGVVRRAGLRHLHPVSGPGRLIAFSFNTEQSYLLVLTDQALAVHRDGQVLAELDTPWSEARLADLHWTQSADTLLVTHPEVAPRRLVRTGAGAFTLQGWTFKEKDGRSLQPFYKFAGEDVTLAASGVSGMVSLSADQEVFTADHADARLRLHGGEARVLSVLSATEVEAEVTAPLDSSAPTRDWEEQAFSPARGWPVAVTFHQDRLVIGGSRGLPNRLWLSQTGDLFNFDLGEGLDDQAIDVALLADQVNAVRAVFPGRHLQVFTTGAEWMVSGEPLTPSSVHLKRQTRVGSPRERHVPPCDVDGATVLVSANGRELREFLFADVEQAYQATDLAMLARHIVDDPRDMAYDPDRRLLHLCLADGRLATLTNYRAEQVTAWTVQHTQGRFLSVAVAGGVVYVLVERDGSHALEVFDDALYLDAALMGESEMPKSVWSGLDHLEGRMVRVLADGALAPDALVQDGAIALADPATGVQVGLAYAHEIAPLPPVASGPRGSGHAISVRLIRVTFRLLDTAALHVDTGRGLAPVPFRRLPADVLDAPAPRLSGDVDLRALGWRRKPLDPLWRIHQDAALPCCVLSVSTETKVTD